MASQTILQQISEIATTIIAVALVVLIGITSVIAWRFRTTYRKMNHVLDRIRDDVNPLTQRLSAIADDISVVTKSVRADVRMVNETIASANDRVQQAVKLTEERLNEFNALLSVVQEEAEQVFVSTAAAVRGVRGGTDAYAAYRRGGMDLASDELDAAELADEIEDQIEDQLESEATEADDGHDSSSESSAETLSAAPRVQPRVRGGIRRRGA